jgi:hypothetical protein
MTYGLQIFASDGITKTFDSTTAYGGCVVDIVTLIPNSGSTPVYNTGTQTGYQYKSYPTATTIQVVLLSGTPSSLSTSSAPNITISGTSVTFPPLDHFLDATPAGIAGGPPEVYLVIAT